jgi:hypothetical protein
MLNKATGGRFDKPLSMSFKLVVLDLPLQTLPCSFVSSLLVRWLARKFVRLIAESFGKTLERERAEFHRPTICVIVKEHHVSIESIRLVAIDQLIGIVRRHLRQYADFDVAHTSA